MILIDKQKCVSCGQCRKVCSYGNGNIIIDDNARIVSTECQECGQCIEVCPTQANPLQHRAIAET